MRLDSTPGRSIDGRDVVLVADIVSTGLNASYAVTWLLRHGADPNIGDAEGRTPLAHAVRRRYPAAEIEELLRHGADPRVSARDGSTPISLASRTHANGMADLLSRYAGR